MPPAALAPLHLHPALLPALRNRGRQQSTQRTFGLLALCQQQSHPTRDNHVTCPRLCRLFDHHHQFVCMSWAVWVNASLAISWLLPATLGPPARAPWRRHRWRLLCHGHILHHSLTAQVAAAATVNQCAVPWVVKPEPGLSMGETVPAFRGKDFFQTRRKFEPVHVRVSCRPPFSVLGFISVHVCTIATESAHL